MIAVQNMEKLVPLKNEALDNPLKFVEKLQRGEEFDFPIPQVVCEVCAAAFSYFLYEINA